MNSTWMYTDNVHLLPIHLSTHMNGNKIIYLSRCWNCDGEECKGVRVKFRPSLQMSLIDSYVAVTNKSPDKFRTVAH